MILALRSGVDPAAWLEDTRALVTAVAVYDEIDSDARRNRRR